MTTRGDRGLDRCARAAVADALASDPALAEELGLIVAHLRPDARDRFWRCFAEECGRCARPAAAVLGALERAAAGPGGGRAPERRA